MAEQIKSITDVRRNLPGLSQTAQKRMDRYVITNQGQPQSVLMGYEEYQGMKAAAELLHRPEAIASVRKGLKELGEGQRLTPEEALARLRKRRLAAGTHVFTAEIADMSGVEMQVVDVVVDTFVDKLKADFSAGKTVNIPGLGDIVQKEKA